MRWGVQLSPQHLCMLFHGSTKWGCVGLLPPTVCGTGSGGGGGAGRRHTPSHLCACLLLQLVHRWLQGVATGSVSKLGPLVIAGTGAQASSTLCPLPPRVHDAGCTLGGNVVLLCTAPPHSQHDLRSFCGTGDCRAETQLDQPRTVPDLGPKSAPSKEAAARWPLALPPQFGLLSSCYSAQ